MYNVWHQVDLTPKNAKIQNIRNIPGFICKILKNKWYHVRVLTKRILSTYSKVSTTIDSGFKKVKRDQEIGPYFYGAGIIMGTSTV